MVTVHVVTVSDEEQEFLSSKKRYHVRRTLARGLEMEGLVATRIIINGED